MSGIVLHTHRVQREDGGSYKVVRVRKIKLITERKLELKEQDGICTILFKRKLSDDKEKLRKDTIGHKKTSPVLFSAIYQAYDDAISLREH